MLHMCPGHLSVHVGDGLRRREEIVKKSRTTPLNVIIIIIIIIIRLQYLVTCYLLYMHKDTELF